MLCTFFSMGNCLKIEYKYKLYEPFDDRPDWGMCQEDADVVQFVTGFNAGGLLGGKFICCPRKRSFYKQTNTKCLVKMSAMR